MASSNSVGRVVVLWLRERERERERGLFNSDIVNNKNSLFTIYRIYGDPFELGRYLDQIQSLDCMNYLLYFFLFSSLCR